MDSAVDVGESTELLMLYCQMTCDISLLDNKWQTQMLCRTIIADTVMKTMIKENKIDIGE